MNRLRLLLLRSAMRGVVQKAIEHDSAVRQKLIIILLDKKSCRSAGGCETGKEKRPSYFLGEKMEDKQIQIEKFYETLRELTDNKIQDFSNRSLSSS